MICNLSYRRHKKLIYAITYQIKILTIESTVPNYQFWGNYEDACVTCTTLFSSALKSFFSFFATFFDNAQSLAFLSGTTAIFR